MQKYRGELGLLIVTLIWGFGFSITNIALNFCTPYEIMVLRFTIAALLLPAIFFKSIKKINRLDLKGGAWVGFFLFMAFLTQTIALQYTTVSKSAFLTTTNVVMVPIIGYMLFKDKLDRFACGGAVMALIGTATLSMQLDLSINIGDALSLLCALFFALHVYFTGYFLFKGSDAIRLTITQMAMASLCSIVLYVFTTGFTPMSVPTEGLLAVFYMGVISTTGSFLLQTVSQKYVNQTKAVVILSMESVFGTMAAFILLGERLSLRMFVGCGIILCGVLLSELGANLFKNKLNKEGV